MKLFSCFSKPKPRKEGLAPGVKPIRPLKFNSSQVREVKIIINIIAIIIIRLYRLHLG